MKTLKNIGIVAVYALIATFGLSSFTDTDGYGIGDKVEDVRLLNVNGKKVAMSDYQDAKGFIVIFTCNTCPYAVASEDRIIALDKKYKDLGYPVIAINPNNPDIQPDDTYELMQKKAAEKQFTFPYLFDESRSVYAQYGAKKTPHVYILAKEAGDMVVKYIGAIDDSVRNAAGVSKTYVEDAVDALLDGREVPVKETRAIGCSVKV